MVVEDGETTGVKSSQDGRDAGWKVAWLLNAHGTLVCKERAAETLPVWVQVQQEKEHLTALGYRRSQWFVTLLFRQLVE